MAALASHVIGGPAGRRLASGTNRWICAATVLALLAFCMVGLGVVEKQHCRLEGWSSPDHFWHACYADTAVLYASGGLGEDPRSSLTTALGPQGLGQSPLSGAAMWVVSSQVPQDGPADLEGPRRFFDLSAVLMALLLSVGVVLTTRAAGRRRWDAAHLALSPLLVTVGVMSYTLLPVALLCGALLAWTRRRTALAGVLLALAAAAAPVLAVVAVAMVFTGSRAGRLRAGAAGAVITIGLWLGVRQLLPGVGDLGSAFTAWRAASPGYGSVWLAPQLLAESRPAGAAWWFAALPPTSVTLMVLISMALVVFAVAVLVLSLPSVPRLAPVALLLVAGLLVTGRNLPVQASLLLLPLIALSGLRWRDHLIWAATELVYFVGVWLYIGGQSTANRGLSAELYLVLLLARIAGIAWIAFQTVRTLQHPRLVDGVEPEPAAVAAAPGAVRVAEPVAV